MAQTKSLQDFQPLPVFQQTTNSNTTWIAVATVKTEPDGTTTQHSQIISKHS